LDEEVLPVVLKGGAWSGELPLVSIDGKVTSAIQSIFLISNEKGEPLYLANVITDISERKKAELQLYRNAEMLTSLRGAQTQFIADGDPKPVFESLLEALVMMTESESGFLDEVTRREDGRFYKKSLAISNISWDDESKKLYEQLKDADFEFTNLNNLAGAPVLSGKLVISNEPAGDNRSGGLPKGHPAINSFMGVPMYFGDDLVGVAGVANRKGGYSEEIAIQLEVFINTCSAIIHAIRNNTRRQQIAAELVESEERFRTVVEQAGDGLFLIEPSGRFVDVNQRVCEQLGYSREELLNISVSDIDPIYHQEVFDDFVRGLKPDKPVLIESVHQRKDKTTFPVEIRTGLIEIGGKTHLLSLARDITDRKRGEEQARQRQAEITHMSRLSTMGELASGIAHELNQPLCAATNYASGCLRLMRSGRGVNDELIGYMTSTIELMERAGNIINSIKKFVRKRGMRRSTTDINDIILQIPTFVNSDIRHAEITLKYELDEHLPMVMADSVQIEQVLLNLIVNAIEVMTDSDIVERNLTIATRQTDEHIEVSVSDTGSGLPENFEDKLFDSFYTTKAEGLGIGLSISHSIIEAHNGRLWAKNCPDGGAVFSFTLPMKGK
jgi:PAS domain S-box-containing protein